MEFGDLTIPLKLILRGQPSMKIGKHMGFGGAESPKKFWVLNSQLVLGTGGRRCHQELLPELKKLGHGT